MKRTNGTSDSRRSVRPLLWLALAAIAAVVTVSSLHAQETPEATPEEEGTQVVVVPPDEVFALGDEFAVEVRVEDVEHLAGFDFAIEFDPELVSFVGMEDVGDFLVAGDRETVCGDPTVNGNSVSALCATIAEPVCLGGPEGPSGSGVLARVVFRAEALGEAVLELSDPTSLILDDIDPCDPVNVEQAVEIPHTTKPGAVLIARPSREVQETAAVIRLEAPAEPVDEGDEFEVRVIVEDAEGLAAFDFAIAFDPALMSFVRMEDLGQFLESGDRTQMLCNDPSVESGEVSTVCSTVDQLPCLGGPEGPSGSGLLARAVFKAKAGGEATLSLVDPTSLILDDINPCDPVNVLQAIEIPLEREGATVEIIGSDGFPWLIVGIVAGVAAVVVVGGVVVLQYSRRGTGGEGAGGEGAGL